MYPERDGRMPVAFNFSDRDNVITNEQKGDARCVIA